MKRLIGAMTLFAMYFGIIAAIPADPQILKRKAVTVTKTETLTQPAPAKAAQVEATAKKTGPIFNIAVRMKMREKLKEKGYGPLQIARAMRHVDDEVINSVMADAETLSGVKVVGTAIGDGKIIDAILDWLKSPQGQAFIDALLKLLLGLLLVDAAEVSPDMFWSILAWYANSNI